MNIQARKLELVQLILNTDRPSILDRISKILRQEDDVDFWDELPTDVQRSINRGIQQARNGETKAHSEVMKKYDKWL